jgi:cytochrome b involved in lipid metabolism
MVGLCGCDGTSQYDVYHTKALLRSIQSELIGDMVQYNDGTPDSHSDNPQGCNCLNCDGNCQCCNANISASEGEGKEDDDRGSSEQTNIPSKEDATDVIIDDETNSHTDIQVIEEIDEPTSIPIVEDPSKNDIENEMDDSVSTPPTQEDESPHPALTMTEVALHSTSDDCYVVYYDQVYFMSTYAPEHPFGASWILNLCGKDGTSRYSRFHQRELLLTVQDMIVGGLIL